MCVCGSKAVSFTRHESITYETSSMVMDVSAMLVATTTLVTPGGIVLKMERCASVDRDECRGKSRARSWLPRTGSRRICPIARSISAKPGRNTSTAPPFPSCPPPFLLRAAASASTTWRVRRTTRS